MENTPNEQTRKTLSIDDLKPRKYISLKIGESSEFVIKTMEEVKQENSDFCLSSVDYRVEITTSDDRILTIQSWELLKVIKEALLKAEKIEGVKLKVSHDGTKMYKAEVVN